MRIISGTLKGRQLLSFKASHIRPTTDRVKESIFNKTMGYIEGARILDLFAGTGNLSIESFSRGAKEVVSVENNKKSVQIIQKNMEHLKIPKNMIKVMVKDVRQYIKGFKGDPFDVIFIDPPFTEKMAHEVMGILSESTLFFDETLIVIESSSQETIEDNYGSLLLKDRKDFGDKWVSFFTL